MKTDAKFPLLSLALLCALVHGTAAPARAQRVTGTSAAPTADAGRLPAPIPARPVADKLAPDGWLRYEIGEPARLSLILPVAPVAHVDRVSVMPGTAGFSRSYMSIADSGVYGLSYLEGLPAALLEERWKREFFEGFVKEFSEKILTMMKARGMDVTLTMSDGRAASVGGLAGYEQDFSYGTVKGRVRLVFGGRTAYAVMAVWNDLSSGSERSAFFESLQVSAKR